MGRLISGPETGYPLRRLAEKELRPEMSKLLDEMGYVASKISSAASKKNLEVLGITGNNLDKYFPHLYKHSPFDLLVSQSVPKKLMIQYYCFTIFAFDYSLDEMYDSTLYEKYKFIMINPTDDNSIFWSVHCDDPELAVRLAISLTDRERFTQIKITKLG